MEQYHAKRYYLEHNRLLEDPEVDAIYLSLSHGLHKRVAIKALKAGKAVLCEIPAVLNEQEMAAVAEEARKSGGFL